MFLLGLLIGIVIGGVSAMLFVMKGMELEAVERGHGYYDPDKGNFQWGTLPTESTLEAVEIERDDLIDAKISLEEKIEEHEKMCPLMKKTKKRSRK